MTTATIAVRGSASDEFLADFALVQFGHQFTALARSESLARDNEVTAHLRDIFAQMGSGVREMKVQSLRVEETFIQVGPDHIRESSGWAAQLWGRLLVDPSTVSSAMAELNTTGVRINQLTWHLDPDTEARAHREVRRLAVANARDAADDFALALGATLGSLITLADPGLLSSATFQNGARRTSHMGLASAGAAAASWDGHVDIDPDEITVSADVEASYEVTLD